MTKAFPITEGLRCQSEDLARMKKILKPEVYDLLAAEAKRQNAPLRPSHHTGYDVWRGCQVYEFAINLSHQLP